MWLACFESKTDLSIVSVLLSPVEENEMHFILPIMMAVIPFFRNGWEGGIFCKICTLSVGAYCLGACAIAVVL